MAYYNILFIVLLIGGFCLLESLCFKRTRIEDAVVQVTETYPDLEDVDHFLFPRESNGPSKNQNRWRADRDLQLERSFDRKESTAKPTLSRWATTQFTRLLKPVRMYSDEDPFDPTAFLECMLKAVQTTLPSVVSDITANSMKTVYHRVTSIFRTASAVQPTPVTISPKIVDSFVEAVEPCFALLPHDVNGKITLPEDFETSPAAEAIKQQPMGILALGAVRAAADNVSVTFKKRRKPQYQYIVNHEGLAYGLGMAAIKSTKIGQIVLKSPEGTSWFTKGVSQSAKETGVQDKTSAYDIPIARRKEAPTTVVALLECVLNAAKATLPIGALASSVFGTVKKQIPGIQSIAAFFQKSEKAATEPSKKPSELISVKVVQAFVKEAGPCFEMFTKNEDGKLVLDPSFLKSAAAEAVRLNPTGALAIGTARAISENVTKTRDEKGKDTYSINYEGLTTGLGLAVMDATKFGRVLRFCNLIAKKETN